MKSNNALKSIIAIVVGLIFAAILMAAIGNNPIQGYSFLFKGGLMSVERFSNTIATAVPLILTGLSVGFAFKTGLFNIGAPGQMLVGGIASTTVALKMADSLPRPILLVVIILIGFLAGGIWAGIVGFLKAKFNVNEVVGAIMLNWVAYWGVFYIIPEYLKADGMETQSRQISEAASLRASWLTNLLDGSFLNYGIIIAAIAVFVIWFIISKTTLGYELKAVGFNKDAAEFAGISVNRNIIISMMISGSLSGLAGVVQYLGNGNCMQTGLMPQQGYDGIAVALLGNNSPIGILFAAIFFGFLYAGKGFMTTMAGIPPEIADTIIAIIIYCAATSMIIDKIIIKVKKKKREKLLNSSVDIKEEK